jgi:hypothetical protein
VNTQYEHEIKRDNGDKIIIRVRYADWCNKFHVDHIGIIPKGKRKIKYIEFTDNYSYRCLNSTDRNKYAVAEYLKLVTLEEIKEAILKAWEGMKPTVESVENLWEMV